MIKRFQYLFASVALLLGVGGLLLAPAMTMAAPIDDACRGLSLADPAANCSKTGAENSASKLIKNVINILSIAVGAVSVIMIIIGGFRYVISNGDTNGLQGAKNTILYAIVGLIVVMFAQVIVRFVLSNAN